MKKFMLILTLAVVSNFALAKGNHGGSSHHTTTVGSYGTGAKTEKEHVGGYTKKDGTHVEGHDRSTKDDTQINNWSTKGNVNPETGKHGTKPAQH